MLLSAEDGAVAKTPEEGEALKDAGYLKCYNHKCNYFMSPEQQHDAVTNDSGYYTCPKSGCYQSGDLLNDMPWHGADQQMDEFRAGGGTRIGLPMRDQAQIGEDLVEALGSIPGYGPITWWHPGGATGNSPLDGTLKEWGIEVKTLGYDDIHHRFIPGSPKEKMDKNEQAMELGLKGILGIMVMLNFKTSMADIYVQEMPIAHWRNPTGRMMQGVSTFRSTSGQRLLEQVPFVNPFTDPHAGMPATSSVQEDPVPF